MANVKTEKAIKEFAVLMYDIHNRLQFLQIFESKRKANNEYKYLKNRYKAWRVQFKEVAYNGNN